MNISAANRVMRKEYLALCMYSLRICRDVEMAQDSVQEACAAVWLRLRDGFEPKSLKAYLYQSVRNETMTLLRQVRHDADVEEADKEVTEEDMDTSERDAAIWRCVAKLPEKRRKIFLMAKRDGMSHAEIAEELGLSVKTVEGQVGKAIASMRWTLDMELRSSAILCFMM